MSAEYEIGIVTRAEKAETQAKQAHEEWAQMSQLLYDMEEKLGSKPGVGHTCLACAVHGHLSPWPEADCPRCAEDLPAGLSDGPGPEAS